MTTNIGRAHQVILEWVGPDVILDDLSKLISPCVAMIQKPPKKRILLLKATFLARF
jgi:hypothetical protein